MNVSGPVEGVCTAAPTVNVTIIGSTLAVNGTSMANALVVLTNESGTARTARSNTFGYYRIGNIPAPLSYTLSANAKGYTFTPQELDISEDLTGVDLIGQ